MLSRHAPKNSNRGEHLDRDRDHSAQAPAAQAVVPVAAADKPRRKLRRDDGQGQGSANHAQRRKGPRESAKGHAHDDARQPRRDEPQDEEADVQLLLGRLLHFRRRERLVHRRGLS